MDEKEILFDAVSFATEAHTGQFRKGTSIPYIIHPLNVGKILINCVCRVEMVVAGILHDTVEDTHVSLCDISERYGVEIANLVEGVSEPDRSDSWENRKKATIEHLKNASEDVLMIACADKLDNMLTLQEQLALQGVSYWQNFNKSVERQYWYYSSLADVFVQQLPGKIANQYKHLVEVNFL